MSRLIDVSLGIGPEMLTWPGDPAADVVPRKQIAKGDSANVSELRIGTHTGTHVDPPVHFIEGADGIDRVPLDQLYGDAVVAELAGANGPVTARDLDGLGLPQETTRLLLKTSNSKIWGQDRPSFPDRYACLSVEAAEWVVQRGIRVVGVDFLSVEEKGAEGHPVHKELLSNGVSIIEGLDLREAPAGPCTLLCFPLKVLNGDGGPARAALIIP
ncbi:MAG TPA: cyclase family protein [Actinomycetota bacterium]|nr:cyclase family protein [Actinomycetota bacterium]